MAGITPYTRSQYPTIEGNDRVYFDNEFRKLEECLRGILDALNGSIVEKTIASGVITLIDSSHLLRAIYADTESAAASDDLATITGGRIGQLAIVRAVTDTRTVVVKDGTGNIFTAGDCTLDNGADSITLFNVDGSNWIELARSNNAA